MKRNLIYHTHISADAQVQVANQENHVRNCHLDAISRDGATLSCDMPTLQALLPNSSLIAPKQPVPLSLCFSLNHANEPIQAACEVIYTRRVSRDRYLLEMKFCDLGDLEYSLIDQYVASNLKNVSSEPLVSPAQENTTFLQNVA